MFEEHPLLTTIVIPLAPQSVSLTVIDNKVHLIGVYNNLPPDVLEHLCNNKLIILALPCLALPCLALAPRGAVGARHDGLPRQFSPLLPVVCHGLSLSSEGFAGPLCDVITPALFRPAFALVVLMLRVLGSDVWRFPLLSRPDHSRHPPIR